MFLIVIFLTFAHVSIDINCKSGNNNHVFIIHIVQVVVTLSNTVTHVCDHVVFCAFHELVTPLQIIWNWKTAPENKIIGIRCIVIDGTDGATIFCTSEQRLFLLHLNGNHVAHTHLRSEILISVHGYFLLQIGDFTSTVQAA